jgi:hypothetical protein
MLLKKSLLIIILFTTFIISGPKNNDAWGNEDRFQTIRLLSNRTSLKINEQFQIIAQYDVTNGNKTTAIGFKIFYNSQYFELLHTEYYDIELFQTPEEIEDYHDDDDDIATNTYISIGWLSPSKIWPYDKTPPFNALTLTMKVKDNSESKMTHFNAIITNFDINHEPRVNNLQIPVYNSFISDINNDGKTNMIDAIQLFQHLIKN